MLTALLRYALGAGAGPGRGARGGVLERPRACSCSGLAWVVLFGLAVYVLSVRSADDVLAFAAEIEGWMTDAEGRRLHDAAAALPGRRPDRRDRQLPGSLDRRPGIRRARRCRGRRGDRPARRQRPRPAGDRRLRRGGLARPCRVRGRPRPAAGSPGASAMSPASPMSPTPRSTTPIDAPYISTAPTVTDRHGPTSATGG